MKKLHTYKGLTDIEVKESKEKYGLNKLTETKAESFIEKYFQSFNDPIITILLIALTINVIFIFFGKVDWFECVGILISVLISTFISTLSEYKNEKNFKKLSKEASRTTSKVYRNGILTDCFSEEIVVGDYILLQTGDLIPADGIILEGKIYVDQSPLNGENKEVEKTKTTDFKKHSGIDFWSKETLFKGCTITQGECIMLVQSVGDNTVYGKLNKDTETISRESPLSLKLHQLAKSISKFGYLGATIVFFITIFQKSVVDNSFDLILIRDYFLNFSQFFSDLTEAVIMGIIVIVVAVPEGLPLMIAIVCSLNMKKMLKNNVLVRKLSGIETAGGLNILFCDKTGTLTKGNLEAIKIIFGNQKETENTDNLNINFRNKLDLSILGNSSVYKNNNKLIGGNSTERALFALISNNPIHIIKKDELTFSSKTKYSASYVEGDFRGCLYKGAPEIILDKCSMYLDENGNETNLLNKNKLYEKLDYYAKCQMRLIALAYKTKKDRLDIIPENMTLVAIVALKDEIRFNVKSSVEAVKMAGIDVCMITGDKKETAVSIAKEVGILSSPFDIVLTSDELSKLSDSEITEKLSRIKVISRALPTDKSRLVKIAQEKGLVVGMTGDGVNDCPALKNADVGFSMGSGTEAAKEAGDIIIMDNNFSSIKNAILYGRTIFKSIKKFITYQLTINIAAVSISVLGPLFGFYKPLNISQMLWINLVMDTLAAMAFGGEAALNKYLKEKPIKRNDKIIDKKMISSVLVGSAYISLASIFIFTSDIIHSLFRESPTDIYFYTAYFSFFIFTCIFNAFNTRSEEIDLTDHLSLNKPFLFIITFIFVIQILMTYLGGNILRTAGLNIKEWLYILTLSVIIIPVDIARKLIIKQ